MHSKNISMLNAGFTVKWKQNYGTDDIIQTRIDGKNIISKNTVTNARWMSGLNIRTQRGVTSAVVSASLFEYAELMSLAWYLNVQAERQENLHQEFVRLWRCSATYWSINSNPSKFIRRFKSCRRSKSDSTSLLIGSLTLCLHARIYSLTGLLYTRFVNILHSAASTFSSAR